MTLAGRRPDVQRALSLSAQQLWGGRPRPRPAPRPAFNRGAIKSRPGAVGALFLLAAAALPAQVAGHANDHYQTPEQRQGLVRGLGRPGRSAEQKPAELVESMALKPGMVVADVGTGVGFMLPYLSRAVGPAGRVLAEDIFDDFLKEAARTVESAKLGNVTIVKGTEKDPRLPENEVDVVFTLDSYHHYDYPAEMLAAMRRALKPGGRLVVVEYHKSARAMPGGYALKHIRLDRTGFEREIEAAGFTLVSRHDHIPREPVRAGFRPVVRKIGNFCQGSSLAVTGPRVCAAFQ